MAKIERRRFMADATVAAAGAGLFVSGVAAQDASKAKSKRKMTINLVCGAIGVSAKSQAEVNALAQKHGFESVEARPHDLAAMSDGQLAELQGKMKEQGIVFGASSLPVDFRKSETVFNEGVAKLPRLAKGL